MPSEFDILAAEFCSDVMSEQFGARDRNGDFVAIKYKPPQDDEFDLIGWSISSINGQEQIDNNLIQTTLVETLKLVGPSYQLVAKDVNSYQRQAIVTVNGTAYQIDPLTTVLGGAMATLGLKRQPLTAQNEMRHAGV